jgi:hypothetical protein
MDEQLTTLNGGTFPTDTREKHHVLAPQVIASILGESDIVFFTNTDYFSHTDLLNARKAGFKIVQLSLSKEELARRNIQRVKDEGYDDMTEWLEGMLEYQSDIADAGLVDQVIDADQPTAELAQALLAVDSIDN